MRRTLIASSHKVEKLKVLHYIDVLALDSLQGGAAGPTRLLGAIQAARS